MPKYKVVNFFHDLTEKRLCRPGETIEVSGTRKNTLIEKNLIDAEPIEEENGVTEQQVSKSEQEQDNNKEENESENEDEYPKHVGGGYYELSNGEKVRGKEEAIEAEKKLSES